MVMCPADWRALRKPVQDAIWREYRPGQERDKQPSSRYLAVSFLAIAERAFKPHDEAAARTVAHYIGLAQEMREQAIADGAGDPLAGLVPS
jgi:hypothetical protein